MPPSGRLGPGIMGSTLQVMAFMIGVIHALGQFRGRLWWNFRKATIALALLHIMRVMAFGTDKPALFTRTGPFTDTLAMDTIAPVPVYLAMTLAAQLLRLIKIEQLIVVADKLVTCLGTMTIETPDAAPTVLQVHGICHQICMHGQLARIFIFGRRWIGTVMAGHPTDG